MDRWLGRVAALTYRHPAVVMSLVAALTAGLALNSRRLGLRTDLIDLMGASAPETALLRQFITEFGYGNRFFVVIEAAAGTDSDAERMEATADRLVAEMAKCGLFSDARSGLSEREVLQVARYYVERFPAFADPSRHEQLAKRLSPGGISDHLPRSAAGLMTPLSTAGTGYFALDPLGLMEFIDPASREIGGFSGFDLQWGGGNRFFSRDHRALLIVAVPRSPGTDYEFAVTLMTWLRGEIQKILGETVPGEPPLRITPAGAHAYAEQSRARIEHDIRLASALSIAGNLLLGLVVYRWLPALLLAFLPTALALVWTTGLVSIHPGEVNLISLSFIAIIAGLGDDQVTYFFTRVPQETSSGKSLPEALRRTYVTTGKSALFCLVTTSIGTLALAMSSFKGLAELGLVLTIGLAMLALHTLFTVPALISIWWRTFPQPRSGTPFRFLPTLARRASDIVVRWPRLVLTAGLGVLIAACLALPGMKMAHRLEALADYDDPAFVGQRLVASRFGVEGTPTVLLVEGNAGEVLDRTERLGNALAPLRDDGQIGGVLTPNSLVPSRAVQEARWRSLKDLDFTEAARALERVAVEVGLRPEVVQPTADRLRQWGRAQVPGVTIDDALASLPSGVLDVTIHRVGHERYLAAVTLSSATPDAAASVPTKTIDALRSAAGPFVEFSYDHLAALLHDQVVEDSRTASIATAAGVVLVVALLFRSPVRAALVLLPTAYGLVVTVGLLAAAGHRFSGMGFAAFPLIIGIGIDNGIHLVRRHLEHPDAHPAWLLTATGAPLIQTNLTTVIGFGALLAASFPPLVELGLMSAAGIGVTLLASLFLLPALLTLGAARRGADEAGIER